MKGTLKWLGICVQNAEFEIRLNCVKFESFRPERMGKLRETLREGVLEREKAEVGKTWNELTWLAQDRFD